MLSLSLPLYLPRKNVWAAQSRVIGRIGTGKGPPRTALVGRLPLASNVQL